MAGNTFPPDYFPTRYWHTVPGRSVDCLPKVQCDLCPRFCQLREGKRGACFIRMNRGGEIVLTSYGRSSGFCIDPIEKKPLNHFYPGSSVLSFGTAGCNLGCKFCQNWDMSKSRQMDTLADSAMPEPLAMAAKERGCTSIAYTYNDPVIFMEYAVNVAKAARVLGIKSVAVSAGYMCTEPRVEFYAAMDAANIDLKSFSESFYRKVCGGHLAPVLDTLLYLKQQTQVWFELTTLLIPGENDSTSELEAMCRWVVDELGPDVPMHFTAFHPDFKMLERPNTPVSTLLKAREIAQKNGIHYAYVGNVYDKVHESTWCPNCQTLLVERSGYTLGQYRLDHKGECPECGHKIAGLWGDQKGEFGSRRIPIHF